MIRTVRDIAQCDPTRRSIVVSAPGSRFKGDTKVTDLLAGWATNDAQEDDAHYTEVKERFYAICSDLSLENFDLNDRLEQIEAAVRNRIWVSKEACRDFVMSRGEWLSAQIIAHALGFEFIDAADFVTFDDAFRYDHERTMMRASAIGLRDRAQNGIVVPGFYGSTKFGAIVTFPRDGSDISGSIVAALTGSSVYENFSDVDGFLATSPKIVNEPERIVEMTYDEARELAFMGSPILQPRAVKYAKDADIPIHVRKTDRDLPEGTWIRPWIEGAPKRPVTGIAVRSGGFIVTIEKYGMDEQIGFLARTAKVFADHRIGIHNCPGSVDTLSFIVLDPTFVSKIATLSYDMELMTGANVRISRNISVICVVGRGMLHTRGVAAKITGALAEADINIVMLNQGSSERNVEVGVDDADVHRAVSALYAAFFGK